MSDDVMSRAEAVNEETLPSPYMTPRYERDLEARAMYAKLTEAKPTDWRIVAPEDMIRGKWYDFCDIVTGKYGQCRLKPGIDAGWHQEPRGVDPTILEYLKDRTHARRLPR